MLASGQQAGRYLPDQDLDHGQWFALVCASGQGFNFDLAKHSRRGVKILIFVVSKNQDGNCEGIPPPVLLAHAKKRGTGRFPGKRGKLLIPPSRHWSTCRGVPASSRPRSWSRVRLGACHRQGFIRWGFDAPVNRPGGACQRQDLDHGRVYLVAPGDACQIKASIIVTGSPLWWPAVNRPGVCVCQRSRLHSWPGEPLTPGDAGQCQGASIMVTGSLWCVPVSRP